MRAPAAIAFTSLFVAANAFAADDVETLEKRLHEEHAALSTQDCVTACKALASIRRAADKICELEPGPRCLDARARADDAQRRVQAACPDCQLAATPPKDEERRAAEPAPPSSDMGRTEGTPRKGGCASCSTPGQRPTGDLGLAILAAWLIMRRCRRIAHGSVRSGHDTWNGGRRRPT